MSSDAVPDLGTASPVLLTWAATSIVQGSDIDRDIDLWLAALRAQGYTARQLEYRARLLGQWAAGMAPPPPSVLAELEEWRRSVRQPSAR